MNTAQALEELGIGDDALTPEQKQSFDENGYFVAEGVFTPDEVAEMRSEFDRLRAIEGDLGGHEVHIEPGAPRLSNMFNKSAAFDRALACAPTLAAAHQLMGEIHTMSLNGRDPLPGQGKQPLHADMPKLHPEDWRAVNTMIMLDDMTADNGPTRLVPGSHKWTPINVPDVNMFDVRPEDVPVTSADRARIPADLTAPYPGEILVTGRAGSVAVISGHVWHGGTVNHSGASRRVLHLFIGRRDVPQQFRERDHLTPALHDRANPAIKYLLDIEDAEPVVFGYPPLPEKPPTWTSSEMGETA